MTLGDVPGLFLYTIVKNQISGATIRIANEDQANRQLTLLVAMRAVATEITEANEERIPTNNQLALRFIPSY